jgi:hypothetical protein
MNVYFVSVGHRPFSKYVPLSFKRYMPGIEATQITDETTPYIVGVDSIIKGGSD